MKTDNAALQAALDHYDGVRDTYIKTLEGKGLVFAKPNAGADVRCALRGKLRQRGAQFCNAGASIRVGWISQACVECTGNRGSETFSTTFKCHRDCYFCFNHNQADYDKFVREGCPWEEGLDRASHTYQHLACLGLTGGEPLLNIDDTIRFLERAGELFPDTHKRMYTSGDLLTEESARRLRDAGLQEIRFSVKNDDPEQLQQRVLANMELAGRYIPDVMVEMPIVPGTEEEMKALMHRFDAAGIKGMNLLEFCFPFHSWDEFARRLRGAQPSVRRDVRLRLLGRPAHRGQRGAGAVAHALRDGRGAVVRHALLLAGQQAPQRDAPDERARRACASVL